MQWKNARYKRMYILCVPWGKKEGRYMFAESHTEKINQKLLKKVVGGKSRVEGMHLRQQG